MSDDVQYFLLAYDRSARHLITELSLGTDQDSASNAYSELESQHRGDENIEVVLLGSDSIETLRLTHANYFEGSRTGSRFLAGL